MNRTHHLQRGSALIVALWSTILLSMLVANLVFNMRLEANTTSMHRKHLHARYAAQAGIEYAHFLILKSQSAFEDENEYGEDFVLSAEQFERGLPVSLSGEIGETTTFSVEIVPEEGRRNVNTLERDEWKALLEIGQVDEERWDELIDCFIDWTDPNDLHQLNGAEEDDAFYRDKDYTVKNAPVDTIDELLLIKNWTREILYGGPAENPDDPALPGIARHLTTLSQGLVNINTATREVLMTLPFVDDIAADAIIAGRLGEDPILPDDDGYTSVDQAIQIAGLHPDLASRLTVDDRRYLRILAVGERQGVRSGIWGIYLWEGRELIPVFWREEMLP